MSANRTPQVVVIAGPNGSGKTSSAADLLQDAVGIDAFVNADVIAQGLAAFDPESAAIEAGRIMLRRVEELGQARGDFAFESTLAGRATHRLLSGLSEAGYDVHILYLWLQSPDLAVARVRRRVEAGGHDVPEPVIRRRFWRSLVNFDRLYRPLTTTWRLYDGGVLGGRPLIAHGAGAGEPSLGCGEVDTDPEADRGGCMSRRPSRDIGSILRDGRAIDEAIDAARRRVIRRHHQLGVPLVIWRDGKVVEVSPESVEAAPDLADTRPPAAEG